MLIIGTDDPEGLEKMADMAVGQEKRMVPVLMEEMGRDAGGGSITQRWWKAITRRG